MEGRWDAIVDLPVEERPLRAMVKGFGGMYGCAKVARAGVLGRALRVPLIGSGWRMHVT